MNAAGEWLYENEQNQSLHNIPDCIRTFEESHKMMESGKRKFFTFFELFMACMTVILKFILMDWLGMRAFYIAGICLFWVGYCAYRYSSDHSILNYWGFKKEGFSKSMKLLLPFAAVVFCFTIIYAYLHRIPVFNPDILPVLVLYPVFGITQQFLLVCILAQNLQHTGYFSSRRFTLMFMVSLMFSLIHYPYLSLMIFTLIMEIVFLTAYMKWRNLWSIGLAHGLIATFLLFYVLNRDLWIELFAWF